MYKKISDIFSKPGVYEHSNSVELWNNPHISKEMLKFHLNPDVDPASRNSAFIEKSVIWLKEKFRLGAGSSVLDLGCGPGLYTQAFAAMGCRVTGIDVSENSIRYASEKAHSENMDIHYIRGNYVTTDFGGGYDLITLIYYDYCVLNPDDRRTLLGKISNALNPGGSFVLDVLSDVHYAKIEETKSVEHSPAGGFWSPDPHFVFTAVHKYDESMVFLQKHTVVEKSGEFTICNYLKCFEKNEIMNELAEHGFKTAELFSDMAGNAYVENNPEITLMNIRS